MQNPLKLGLTILACIVGGILAWNIVVAVVGWALKLAITVGVVAAIGLIIYGVFFRKALGGGRSGRLP